MGGINLAGVWLKSGSWPPKLTGAAAGVERSAAAATDAARCDPNGVSMTPGVVLAAAKLKGVAESNACVADEERAGVCVSAGACSGCCARAGAAA